MQMLKENLDLEKEAKKKIKIDHQISVTISQHEQQKMCVRSFCLISSIISQLFVLHDEAADITVLSLPHYCHATAVQSGWGISGCDGTNLSEISSSISISLAARPSLLNSGATDSAVT